MSEVPNRRKRWIILGIAVGVLFAAFGSVAAAAATWGSNMSADGRLLPGTTIAGIDVGELTADEARAAVTDDTDIALDQVVTVTSDSESWEITARELNASVDVDGAIEQATEATAAAGTMDLIRYRWLGETSNLDIATPLHVDDDAIIEFVERIADEIDRDPVDAVVELDDAGLQLASDVPGAQLDREEAIDGLRNALLQGDDTVDLPVETPTATLTADQIATVLPDVEEAITGALDRTLTIQYGDQTWQTTPRELDATTDVDREIASALGTLEAAGDTETPDASPTNYNDGEASIEVPTEPVAAFVDQIALEVDTEPVNASLEASGGSFNVISEQVGAQVDSERANELLHAAALGGDTTFELPVETLSPSRSADQISQLVPDLEAHVEAALDRTVTVHHDDERWTTSARELGASADPQPVLESALDSGTVEGSVPMSVPDDEVSSFVSSIASEVDVAAVDATYEQVGEGVEVTEGESGLSVDQTEATRRIRSALDGNTENVTLPVDSVAPDQSIGDFEHVLVLRQSDLELDLYLEGDLHRTWPVAVGTGGSPTPTGEFTIGAKRYEPTWVNPAPDRWGADMPDQVGPGPDNPLGVRALNWNNASGGDTLIRFHGTPNESSIGSASSNGCVRMYNEDVVELYDLVPSGTLIISLA